MLGCWGYRIKLVMNLNQNWPLLPKMSSEHELSCQLQRKHSSVRNGEGPILFHISLDNPGCPKLVKDERFEYFYCNKHSKGHTKVTLIWLINNRRKHTSVLLLREQLPFLFDRMDFFDLFRNVIITKKLLKSSFLHYSPAHCDLEFEQADKLFI